MRRQRNRTSMKKQKDSKKKKREREINEMEVSSSPDTEFKKIVIVMLKEFSENFNKKIAVTKKNIETIIKSLK